MYFWIAVQRLALMGAGAAKADRGALPGHGRHPDDLDRRSSSARRDRS
jgi:hypothetical protein